MDQSAHPPGSGENRTNYLIYVTWVQCAVSIVFVALRFWSRARITRNIWWDDWAILIPLFFILVASSLLTVYASYGGARHFFDVPPKHLSKVIELDFVSQVFTGKMSVALLIYRLQSPSKWRTCLLVFLSTSTFVVGIFIVGIFFGQCAPAKTLWTPTAGHCWDTKKTNDWDIAASAYFALVDLVLALLPTTLLRNMPMSWTRKIALSILLGLGVFAAIAAAIISYLPTLTVKADVTWITVDLLIWNTTEMNVIIYAACLPAIRPLFVHYVEKISGYVSGKRLFFGQGSSGGENSTRKQHYKIGSAGSMPYGSRSRKDGSDMDNDAHELRPQGIKGPVDVEVRYGIMDHEPGRARNSLEGSGWVPTSERQTV